MLVKYQHKWSSMFPDDELIEESPKEWSVQLAGLTLDHIKYGIDACLEFYPEWPPNPGEFRLLCKSAEIEPDYKPAQIDNPTKPETVQTEIQKMRGML